MNYQGVELRDIPGFSNYMVGNNGEIYSKLVHRFITHWHDNKGYPIIRLKDDTGKKKCFKIHRVVAQQFVPNPHNFPQVNHKDENKRNNNASNLEWCTNLYNSRYGTRGVRIGKAHLGMGKTILCFDKNWNFVKEYQNQKATEIDGFNQSDVSRVILGKQQMTKGMRFVNKEDYFNEFYWRGKNQPH